ncbi:uncharacterized protein BDZ99DRAFT_470495 [Mytilinidion resinicola]|uniref:Uncharacterized protein n=1 Tax=Mytilinidion resinicola TaxID=574789 RepID=A0A6A6ZB98_9PEZI|nr:uncharacterized protein BDZ99DRAFT_470495 [Mytilinidion resinicola]KAF2817497.1 hypothetical protein BDZ99DRAFT_470495 [Mytilinidion resinicola]
MPPKPSLVARAGGPLSTTIPSCWKSGVIFPCAVSKSFFSGTPTPEAYKAPESLDTKKVIAILVPSALLFAALFVLSILLCRRRMRNHGSGDDPLEEAGERTLHHRRRGPDAPPLTIVTQISCGPQQAKPASAPRFQARQQSPKTYNIVGKGTTKPNGQGWFKLKAGGESRTQTLQRSALPWEKPDLSHMARGLRRLVINLAEPAKPSRMYLKTGMHPNLEYNEENAWAFTPTPPKSSSIEIPMKIRKPTTPPLPLRKAVQVRRHCHPDTKYGRDTAWAFEPRE